MLYDIDKDCFHHPLVGVFVVEWVSPAEAAYLFLWLSFMSYSMHSEDGGGDVSDVLLTANCSVHLVQSG